MVLSCCVKALAETDSPTCPLRPCLSVAQPPSAVIFPNNSSPFKGRWLEEPEGFLKSQILKSEIILHPNRRPRQRRTCPRAGGGLAPARSLPRRFCVGGRGCKRKVRFLACPSRPACGEPVCTELVEVSNHPLRPYCPFYLTYFSFLFLSTSFFIISKKISRTTYFFIASKS